MVRKLALAPALLLAELGVRPEAGSEPPKIRAALAATLKIPTAEAVEAGAAAARMEPAVRAAWAPIAMWLAEAEARAAGQPARMEQAEATAAIILAAPGTATAAGLRHPGRMAVVAAALVSPLQQMVAMAATARNSTQATEQEEEEAAVPLVGPEILVTAVCMVVVAQATDLTRPLARVPRGLSSSPIRPEYGEMRLSSSVPSVDFLRGIQTTN